MTGVIQHVYTSPVADGTVTSVVRPRDWNSGHAFTLQDGVLLGGNTAGVLANISSGSFFLAGGNNITLSQNGNSVTVSGGVGPTIALSAGTLSALRSDVTFSDSNGVSWGLNTNGVITATVQTNYLTTAMQSNAATISNIKVSAGTLSNNLSALTFSDSNGVSWGLNGSVITATVQTNYLTTAMQSNAATISNIKVSAGAASNLLSAITFTDSNGISWGLNGSVITATVVTSYLTSQSNQALSGSNGSFAFQTATFGNLNGMSFYTSNGSLVGSYTVPAGTTISSYENNPLGAQQSQGISGSISCAVAFMLPQNGSFSYLRIPVSMTNASTTISTTGTSANMSVSVVSTWNAVVYSLGTGASSRSLVSVASGSNGWTLMNSISVAVNGTQYSISQFYSANAEGAGTTRTTQYSASTSNMPFSSTAFSEFSGGRFVDIPFATSLSAGPYWLIFGVSTNSGTNSASMAGASNCLIAYTNHYGASNFNAAFGVIGSTNLTSGAMLGAGSFSTAGGGTTSILPISAISSSASHVKPYFQMLRQA